MVGTTAGDAAGNRCDSGDSGDGMGCGCGCAAAASGVSSFSEIEAGDEGRDKASCSSTRGVSRGVGVNATDVPKDDVEDVDEDEGESEGLVAPGSCGGGGGGGKTIASDTSGSAGSPPKSGNVANS